LKAINLAIKVELWKSAEKQNLQLIDILTCLGAPCLCFKEQGEV